jgi:hypothetical protein
VATQRTDLFVAQGTHNSHVATPVQMVKREDFGAPFDPMIRLDDTASQALMDALWDAGLRPSARGCESDLVEAKDAHIGDLRALLNRVTGEFHAGTVT